MDPQLLELLRCLQSGPHDSTTLGRICELLRTQYVSLKAQGDAETLAELGELIEVWAVAHAAAGGDEADGRGVLYGVLGELRSGAADLDGAIAAYEQALDAAAEPEVILRLADLFARRAGPGDAEQAADLYCTLGEAEGNPAGIPMLERALDLLPSHPEAMALLEQYLSARAQRARSGRTVVGFKLESDPKGPQLQAAPPAARAVAAQGWPLTAAPYAAPAAAASGVAQGSVARASVPPGRVAPVSVAPASVARASVPPGRAAPVSVAPVAAAPISVAPVAAAPISVAPVAAAPDSVPPAASAATPARSASQPPPVVFEEDPEPAPRGRFASPALRWVAGGVVLAGAVAGFLVFGSRGSQTEPAPTPVVTPVSVAPAAAMPVAAPAPTPVAAAPVVAPSPAVLAEAAAPAAVSGEPPAAQAPQSPKSSGPHVQLMLDLASSRGGKLTSTQLAAGLEGAQPKLERCYAQARKKKPRTEGRLTLTFMVRTNGRVMRVKKADGTIKDATLYRCTAAVIAATHFAKPKRKTAQVKLPIDYSVD